MDALFKGLFDSELTNVITPENFLLCLGSALVLGLILAFAYMYKSHYTNSFVITLALLPAVVCIVVMLVNGNIGTGVAIAGAFSLVRFRSVPGTAREICALFLAMATGLIVGMGYLMFGLVFVLVMGAAFLLYTKLGLGCKQAAEEKVLSVTIPEDLNYSQIFEDIFQEYTKSHQLARVKTTNMGSLFRVTYLVVLKDPNKEKEMIDAIRCRNGNLEVSMSIRETAVQEL